MANINQLPYFQILNTKETNKIAQFLLKKIKKILREKYPYHYLIFARQDKRLEYIQKMSKKYKYFLKLDIEKYYPLIKHNILLANIWKLNFHIFASRRMRHLLKYEIPEFLEKSPIKRIGSGKLFGLGFGRFISSAFGFEAPKTFSKNSG